MKSEELNEVIALGRNSNYQFLILNS